MSETPITMELISEGRFPGEWLNRRQLELLGVPWPAQKGWMDKAVQNTISEADRDEFRRLKGHILTKGRYTLKPKHRRYRVT